MVVNRQYTVLLIDDSQEDRVVYQRYLKQAAGYSYDILEADLATVGLEICQTALPDAILLGNYSVGNFLILSEKRKPGLMGKRRNVQGRV